MARSERKPGQKKHHCPAIPAGWTVKFSGPALEPGDTVEQANARWAAHLRRVQRLRPMPRTLDK